VNFIKDIPLIEKLLSPTNIASLNRRKYCAWF